MSRKKPQEFKQGDWETRHYGENSEDTKVAFYV